MHDADVPTPVGAVRPEEVMARPSVQKTLVLSRTVVETTTAPAPEAAEAAAETSSESETVAGTAPVRRLEHTVVKLPVLAALDGETWKHLVSPANQPEGHCTKASEGRGASARSSSAITGTSRTILMATNDWTEPTHWFAARLARSLCVAHAAEPAQSNADRPSL
jgi:hypothetical protein